MNVRRQYIQKEKSGEILCYNNGYIEVALTGPCFRLSLMCTLVTDELTGEPCVVYVGEVDLLRLYSRPIPPRRSPVPPTPPGLSLSVTWAVTLP